MTESRCCPYCQRSFHPSPHRLQQRADGKELYYVSPDDFLTAVEIRRTGDTVRAGTPKKLFPVTRISNRRNRYVVSADGQRFLAVTAPPEKTPEPLTVVLNWPALLKQK